MDKVITAESVKDMTHIDRMSALGQTVRRRMNANWVLVHPKSSNNVKRDALAAHAEAARLAALLRY